ncbi:helix-turn-helix transcriptional regulator [Phaeobacter sp. B1627]|uniref:helix-turn-helix transcriptional regulator n=1 Tax=Phaeobacter sp. B1627 TaxID=2583809 RepID=UPI00111B7460|nr:helix-turn-helix transcriptional regulator [Phaeobacter sp. B1627]TNJ47492.1 helix-turn-helix domain-containing protein [Phaeobacter sp. B1627]
MTDLNFPDHEFLTVRELAELLRLKERKIYDLAASGEVPCSRATGKLLFPAGEIRAWLNRAKSGGATTTITDRPQILLGSHDPLLDWAIRQSRSGLATYFDGSMDGLERFTKGEGIATGLHLHDGRLGTWNITAVQRMAASQNAVLIQFASRQRGLVYREGVGELSRLQDLTALRLVPRQPGSGTDRLLRDLAADAEVDLDAIPTTDVARSEDEAVEHVRRGAADVTFGLESVAQGYGLRFTPIVKEEFALLVDRKAWFEAGFQTFLSYCQTDAFAKRAASLGGYDVSSFGTVAWNA